MDSIVSLEKLFHILTRLLPYFFTTLIVAETIYLLIRFKKFHFRETKVNIITGLSGILAQAIVKTYFLTNLYPTVYEYRIWDIGLGMAGVVAGIFCVYVYTICHALWLSQGAYLLVSS